MRAQAILWNRRLWRLAVVLLAMAVLIAALPQPATAEDNLPDSMASLGDSITRAFSTGTPRLGDAPENSWSTGSNPQVNSIYLRLLELNPAIEGNTRNLAISGSKMELLAFQAARLDADTELVTILMGANDVCAASEAEMTAVETYRTQFEAAMAIASLRAPDAEIYVASIPSLYRLWEVLHTRPGAVTKWTAFGTCQSMLANPTSSAPADADRRARVDQRTRDFNAVLAAVCAEYPQCRFDGNAVYNDNFNASDISTFDYFHPSLSGQQRLARVAWAASGLEP